MKNDIVGRRYKKKGEVREEVKKTFFLIKKERRRDRRTQRTLGADGWPKRCLARFNTATVPN